MPGAQNVLIRTGPVHQFTNYEYFLEDVFWCID